MVEEPRSETPTAISVVEQAGGHLAGGFVGSQADLFADDFVFHYFNTQLPDLAGDYHGHDEARDFFARLGEVSDGTFSVEPVSLTPFGDELVAAQATISLTISDIDLELDALVLWRVVDGQVREVWDIPAVNTTRLQDAAGA